MKGSAVFDNVAAGFVVTTYLQLNLGLSNVLLAAVAASNLLGFGDLGTDTLRV